MVQCLNPGCVLAPILVESPMPKVIFIAFNRIRHDVAVPAGRRS